MSFHAIDPTCHAEIDKTGKWLDISFPLYWLKEYAAEIEECDSESRFRCSLAIDED